MSINATRHVSATARAPLQDVEVDTGAEADIEAGAGLDDDEVPAVTGDINSEDDASPEVKFKLPFMLTHTNQGPLQDE